MAGTPFALGTLNLALTHITLASFPALNVGPQNMGTNMARLTFDGDIVRQLDVAAGVVPSPEPYVMGNIAIDLLKSQSLASAWWSQIGNTGNLGTVTVYPDSTTFSSITLSTTVVRSFNPDAYDGRNAVIAVQLRGVAFINNDMWSQ